MGTETCGDCRFWSKRSDSAGEMGGGFCRRFPPLMPSGFELHQVSTVGAEIEPSTVFLNDAWPMVHQQSWCGEYRALESEAGK